MPENEIETRFRDDIKDHQMHVLMDNGLHRHLKFQREDSSCYHFNITTWPGHLAISGDMGTWVFARLPDMFDFFLERPDPKNTDGLTINTGYWAEKLQAYDRQGDWKVFSNAELESVMRQQLRNWVQDYDVPKGVAELAWERIEEDILIADNDIEAHEMARDFIFSRKVGGTQYQLDFADSWELCFLAPRHHYIWCCYAIVYAIRCYNQRNSKAQGAA